MNPQLSFVGPNKAFGGGYSSFQFYSGHPFYVTVASAQGVPVFSMDGNETLASTNLEYDVYETYFKWSMVGTEVVMGFTASPVSGSPITVKVAKQASLFGTVRESMVELFRLAKPKLPFNNVDMDTFLNHLPKVLKDSNDPRNIVNWRLELGPYPSDLLSNFSMCTMETLGDLWLFLNSPMLFNDIKKYMEKQAFDIKESQHQVARYQFVILAESLPGVHQVFVSACPTGGHELCDLSDDTYQVYIRDWIIHLNDVHEWSREQIADWLDDLQDNHGFNFDFVDDNEGVTQ